MFTQSLTSVYCCSAKSSSWGRRSVSSGHCPNLGPGRLSIRKRIRRHPDRLRDPNLAIPILLWVFEKKWKRCSSTFFFYPAATTCRCPFLDFCFERIPFSNWSFGMAKHDWKISVEKEKKSTVGTASGVVRNHAGWLVGPAVPVAVKPTNPLPQRNKCRLWFW